MTVTAPTSVVPAACDDAGEAAEPPQRLTVDVLIEDDGWLARGDVAAVVEAAATIVATHFGADVRAQAVILLDDDGAVHRLNRTYRGLDKPTNVLSFPAETRPTPPVFPVETSSLGDIIIARETVEREAADLGVPLAHHLQHLTVHGLLHLIGYDHETAADATVMEQLETALLARLDIPDPYAGSEPA